MNQLNNSTGNANMIEQLRLATPYVEGEENDLRNKLILGLGAFVVLSLSALAKRK